MDVGFPSPFFFCWKSLALPAFIFFILTNNNIPLLPYFTINIIIYISSSLCQLKATALQSRRGGWPSQ
jgi:hypothetical protein